jgi:formamidopyrimidine-DNA glycosylase
MPELPEVETTRRGIEPHLRGRRIVDVVVREARLRWPVAADLPALLRGQQVTQVTRRAKYLLIGLERGTVIVHLGMSGSLRVASGNEPPRPHDHVDLLLHGGRVLRLHDPRRFGSIHYTHADPGTHRLLAALGVEPLSEAFDGGVLTRAAQARRGAVKTLIMDSHIVVGVGNIYASESLYLAGIHPARSCARIAPRRYASLAAAIRQVLASAIADGGTTLRDFVNGVGEPGYFAQSLNVYGRAGAPCRGCGAPIKARVIAQRNTFFCTRCQR